MVSEKATIEVADRANQIIVTDYTENIRFLGELIKELDVPAGGDTIIEFFTLKYSEAEELGNLLTLILNSQPAPPSSPSSPPRTSSSRSTSTSFPPGVFPGGNPESSPMTPPSGSSSPAGGAAQSSAIQVKIWPDKVSNRLIVAAQKCAGLDELQRFVTGRHHIIDVNGWPELQKLPSKYEGFCW